MDRRRPHRLPLRPLVLIVDGHGDTRHLYGEALAWHGFETIIAEDGIDAMRRAWETHPDIIVTEVAFPHGDGWTFVHDLKSNPRMHAIPIVVLTGQPQVAVRERARHEGCAAVFVKPYLPDQLASALRGVLDGSST
jgi:CheY-like chemotaxis protein